MKQNLCLSRTLFVASLLLFPLAVPVSILAAEQVEGTRALQTQNRNQIAVESTQDSLKACLERIPEDASAGQLLLAQQNCQQVAVERTGTALTF